MNHKSVKETLKIKNKIKKNNYNYFISEQNTNITN